MGNPILSVAKKLAKHIGTLVKKALADYVAKYVAQKAYNRIIE